MPVCPTLHCCHHIRRSNLTNQASKQTDSAALIPRQDRCCVFVPFVYLYLLFSDSFCISIVWLRVVSSSCCSLTHSMKKKVLSLTYYLTLLIHTYAQYIEQLYMCMYVRVLGSTATEFVLLAHMCRYWVSGVSTLAFSNTNCQLTSKPKTLKTITKTNINH